MRRCAQAFVFSVLLIVGRTAYADPVSVGDSVRFLGSDGTLGGGAFLIDNTANGPGMDFLTFCIQMRQHIDYSHPFRVGSITGYADDAGGPDYLAPETAWIFSSFRHHNLNAFSSNEIQAAIWILENEWTINVGNSAGLIALANAGVSAGWVNDGVSVLNLFYLDGRPAQDQLTLTEVPEPGTLMLVGGGVVALLQKQRNRSRRSTTL